jgi:CMP-N,N'-diacetyllegionaminic acid synthase
MNLVNGEFTSRQQVPKYLRINGSYYSWRPEVANSLCADYLKKGKYVGYETPEKNSMSLDSIDELEQLESLLKTGTVKLIDD